MRIIVDLARQCLSLLDDAGGLIREYPVSTARLGAGEQRGSYQTPRGLHAIRAKIGAGLPAGAVLKGRRPTGEICTPELMAAFPDRDWILSRIMWLSGCMPGVNRLGDCNSMGRYIYIHGTPDSEPMGVPKSHGCVRMRNADVIDLFDQVPVGTPVEIRPADADDPTAFPVCRLSWQAARTMALIIRPELLPALTDSAADEKAMHFFIQSWQGIPLAFARVSREGRVDYLAVKSEWQGYGLGGKLMQAVLVQAHHVGWYELRANSLANAGGFYGHFGFEAIGDTYLARGVQMQMMRRFLA